MRWLVMLVFLASTACFIWTEQRGVQNDEKTAFSDECNDAAQLTQHHELAERCRLAKRMVSMAFADRLQHRAVEHTVSSWNFLAQHQFLKTWYVQLTAPFVFIAFLYLRNDSNKERIRQEYHYKVFHENLVHTEHREAAQQELFNEMFTLYRRHLPDARSTLRIQNAPVVTEVDDD